MPTGLLGPNLSTHSTFEAFLITQQEEVEGEGSDGEGAMPHPALQVARGNILLPLGLLRSSLPQRPASRRQQCQCRCEASTRRQALGALLSLGATLHVARGTQSLPKLCADQFSWRCAGASCLVSKARAQEVTGKLFHSRAHVLCYAQQYLLPTLHQLFLPLL